MNNNLPKNPANYVALTPITFLKRASLAYANRTSIIYGDVTFTWRQTYERCCRLASSLRSLNILKNDVVSVLAPNVPALYEMHFAVPMAGAVLNPINTRLDPNIISTILRDAESKILFVDYQYLPLARHAIRILTSSSGQGSTSSVPLLAVIDEELPSSEYEQLVSQGDPLHAPAEIADEWDPITLNYTSGTTGEPKGVVYSHRCAYLGTLAIILAWEMKTEPVFLWSHPMFHCNGWTFPWGIAARGGTNVCMRGSTASELYQNISSHNVTHMCGAPALFSVLLEAKPHERRPIRSTVEIMTGGAPPPSALLERIESIGFRIVHAYGMTEATGPATVCEWDRSWNELPRNERSALKARQGISVLTLSDVDVIEAKTTRSVPRDGTTMGEIVLRGSSLMKGYFKDEEANERAFRGGWYFTGDLGVMHADGYLEVKDRSQDVIIGCGENVVSSVEVQSVLYENEHVVEAAVVAMPSARDAGEGMCAFVKVRDGSEVKESDILCYCKENLPGFMVPEKVVFVEELPKTSTGKFQTFQLRALAKSFGSDGKSCVEEIDQSAAHNGPDVVVGDDTSGSGQV